MKSENILGLKAADAVNTLQNSGYQVQLITTKSPKAKQQSTDFRVVRSIIKENTAYITIAAFCTQIETSLSACNDTGVKTEEE